DLRATLRRRAHGARGVLDLSAGRRGERVVIVVAGLEAVDADGLGEPGRTLDFVAVEQAAGQVGHHLVPDVGVAAAEAAEAVALFASKGCGSCSLLVARCSL